MIHAVPSLLAAADEVVIFEGVRDIMTEAQFNDLAARLNARNREREVNKHCP